MKEMTKEEKINAERNELNVLIKKGIVFDLDCVTYERKGLFRKSTPVEKTLKYTIQEPTLSTLDRMAAEQIDLVIDESLMSSDNAINEAKKLTSEHSLRLARIVAIAVLGQDYVRIKHKGSQIKYSYDDNALNSLTQMFFQFIKPSKLMQIVVLINTMSNLGDFCNSIRLMSAERTTMPIRIEANKEG